MAERVRLDAPAAMAPARVDRTEHPVLVRDVADDPALVASRMLGREHSPVMAEGDLHSLLVAELGDDGNIARDLEKLVNAQDCVVHVLFNLGNEIALEVVTKETDRNIPLRARTDLESLLGHKRRDAIHFDGVEEAQEQFLAIPGVPLVEEMSEGGEPR